MKYFISAFIFFTFFALNLFNCKQPHEEKDPFLWKWEFVGKPLDDGAIMSITLHPEDDQTWFVTSWRGIYITRNGGESWEQHLSGFCPALEVDPYNPSKIFVGSGKDIYLSEDGGKNWVNKFTFPSGIISILVSAYDHSVYVGIAWEAIDMSNGIYKSTDMGNTWEYHSYNVEYRGLIPWDIEEDKVNHMIYIATEIYDHPQPYNPPFLRSSDGGMTWKDVSGSLPWHVIKIQVQPTTQKLYVLTEGMGLYVSSDYGDQWEHHDCPFYLYFLIDKNNPQRFFGGAHTYTDSLGGVYQSINDGQLFYSIGLTHHIVSGLCLNRQSTVLYAACYQDGIYRAK
jgi:hypothetical protein